MALEHERHPTAPQERLPQPPLLGIGRPDPGRVQGLVEGHDADRARRRGHLTAQEAQLGGVGGHVRVEHDHPRRTG